MFEGVSATRQTFSSPFVALPSDASLPAGTMIGVGEGVKTLFAAAPFVVDAPAPVVSNLFRIGIFTRCDSTKSTPSAVSVKSELSARVMYPLFQRYHAVNSK